MPPASEITRTEQRIAEIDALQQTIDQLQQDLQLYGQTLRHELDLLQQEVAAMPTEQEEEPVDEEPVDEPPLDEEPVDEELPDSMPGEINLGDDVPAEPANLGDAEFTDIDSEVPVGQLGVGQRSPFELEELEGGDKIGGKPVSVLISDGTVSEEPLNGWVLDRPTGGLKILVDDEIKPGTVIGVRPNREHPDAQWINVSVKSIKAERQSFLITCQFVERPPWKALALFNG
jgi:hypothetical protein